MKLYMTVASVVEQISFNRLVMRILESIEEFLPIPDDVPWSICIECVSFNARDAV